MAEQANQSIAQRFPLEQHEDDERDDESRSGELLQERLDGSAVPYGRRGNDRTKLRGHA